MFYVYLLKSNRGRIYIGYTANLKRRISEHNAKKVYYTKRHEKWTLYYYEAYSDKEVAQEREKKLKQYGSAHHGLLKRLK